MSDSFKNRLDLAPYPNLSTANARHHFIDTYLPEIKQRLKESSLLE
jgi:hypothetical protein